MDRAERTGLGIAAVAHVALFAALSLNLLKPPTLPKLETSPVEVSLVEDIALQSSAPDPSPAPAPPSQEAVQAPPPPAPMPAPVAEPAPAPAQKTATKTVPKPKPDPKPVKKAEVAKPAAKTSPSDDRPRRRPGLSRDILGGVTPETASTAPARPGGGTPAATIGPEVTSSIGAEIRRQLKPHWKSPTGADVELLRTTIAVRLNRDGSISGNPELVSQTGVNASNRAQARLHVDQAIKAVRLAAPFKLPAEYYEAWREIRPTFDRRLSQ